MDNATRWTSTFKMLDRFIELYSPIIDLITTNVIKLEHDTLESLNPVFFTKLQCYHGTLKLFTNFTNLMQSENDVTVSQVPSNILSLWNALQDLSRTTQHSMVKEFAERLSQSVDTRLYHYLNHSNIYIMASLLDHRTYAFSIENIAPKYVCAIVLF